MVVSAEVWYPLYSTTHASPNWCTVMPSRKEFFDSLQLVVRASAVARIRSFFIFILKEIVLAVLTQPGLFVLLLGKSVVELLCFTMADYADALGNLAADVSAGDCVK